MYILHEVGFLRIMFKKVKMNKNGFAQLQECTFAFNSNLNPSDVTYVSFHANRLQCLQVLCCY